VVLVGQHTDCCVRHTAYDAFAGGYEFIVCPDATAVFELGSDEPVSLRQARALEYLNSYYGARLESSDVVG
jgi:nicotinamidase-related amidase